MMKFFRIYNKQMLAVLMALLLVVWLGGSALQTLFTPDNSERVIFKTAHGDIREADQLQANHETRLLSMFQINWRRPSPLYREPEDPVGIAEWILLTREAERHGLGLTREETRSILALRGFTTEIIRNMARSSDLREDYIVATLGKYLSVQRLATYVTSNSGSEAAARVAARTEMEKVKVNLVALGAPEFAPAGEEFTEEQMQAHFEKYRDQVREERMGGKATLKCGYRMKPEVNVEYWRIDLDKVAEGLRLSDATLESRAKEFWKKNQNNPAFVRPPEPPKETPAEGDETKEHEPEKPRSTYFETFEEAREPAIKAVRREFARDQVERMTSWLLNELTGPWFDALVGPDGYKSPPAGVTQDDYPASVLARLPEALRHADAITVQQTGYVNRTKLSAVPGLGQASTPAGTGRTFRVADLAFSVQGLAAIPTGPGADPSMFLAKYQPSPLALAERTGNTYLFRVIGSKDERPAETLDAVREQVAADLRNVRGFEIAREYGQRLAAAVTGDGLKAAYEADEELKVSAPSAYFTPPPFGKPKMAGGGKAFPVFVSGLGQVETDFVETCMALEKAASPRVAVLAEEALATVVVVEWVESTPVRLDEYGKRRDQLIAQASQESMSRSMGQWLDPQRVRDRNGFAPAGP